MTRTSIATDDFNRAGPDLGTNWSNMDTASPGDIKINSSVKFCGQYGMQAVERRACARWVGAGTFTDDQYSSAYVSGIGTVPSSSAAIGVICRASGNAGTRTFYEMLIVGDGTGVPHPTTLCKWVSGTRTLLYSAEISWADNDEISLECEGTTIRACRNGAALGGSWTVTDSSITTGAPGVASSASSLFGDNWAGGNISTTASVSSRKLLLGVGA